MNKKFVKELIRSKETYRIERTISTKNRDKFCEAICAFSNDLPRSGKLGYLLVGVEDDGSLSGLKVTDELLTFFAGLRTDGNILPIPIMTVDHVSFEEGDVIVVTVTPAPEPPVRYRGRCHIRIGSRKDIATEAEEDILSEKRLSARKSFDMSPCRDASLESLDLSAFSRLYLPKAIAEDVLAADTRDIKEQLCSLRLFDKQYDCPTNAAVLLFGKNSKYFFPGAYIQHVLFDGLDNASEILNQNEFTGNLIYMLPRLEAFVETSVIQKRPSPVSVLQEKILVNYPQWAIRELLMNAVMHRDYRTNTPTKFYQYANRLEIVNPGGLYGNARPENFPDVNDYRNPVIAEALKVLGYVNKFNRGIARVQKELVDNGNGLASFTVDKITVFSVSVINAKSQNVNEPTVKGFESSVDVKDLMFSDKSLKVLRLCQSSAYTKKELLLLIGVTNQTLNVRNIVNPLINAGCIAPVEEDKGLVRNVHYITTDRGKAFMDYLSSTESIREEKSGNQMLDGKDLLLFPEDE